MPSAATDIITPYSIAIAVSCLAIMALTGRIIRIFPWLVGCFLRPKDCLNLEDAFSAARDRNWVCFGMTPALIVISSWCAIYPPFDFLAPDTWKSIGWYAMLFFAYSILRWGCTKIFQGKRMDKGNYKYCIHVSLSFYAFFAIAATVTAAICAISGLSPEFTRSLLLWESGICYFANLLRTTQIFAYYKGYLRAFLYLCTLEILPTAILLIPAAIL